MRYTGKLNYRVTRVYFLDLPVDLESRQYRCASLQYYVLVYVDMAR